MILKEIQISNFRGIEELTIKNLNKINLIVGENGACKTTILDAIYLLINPNNPELLYKTNAFRGIDILTANFWNSFFYDFDLKNEAKISCNYKNKKRSLQIKPLMTGEESLEEMKKDLNAQLMIPATTEPEITGIKIQFDSKAKESHEMTYESRVAGNKLGRMGKIDDRFENDLFGEYLNGVTILVNDDLSIKFDSVNERGGKEVIIEFVKSFFPTITDLELNADRRIKVSDRKFKIKPLLNTYGDGITHAFRYYLGLVDPFNHILLIDEIENGLHWKNQQIAWEFLGKAVKKMDKQIFATTHSSEMAKNLITAAKKNGFIDIVKLFRVEKNQNKTNLVEYSSEEFEYAVSHNKEIR